MRKWLFVFFLIAPAAASGQDSTAVPFVEDTVLRVTSKPEPHSKPKDRQWLIGGVTTGIYAGLFIWLNESWYKNYPRSGFHTFDDSGEWLQMDKVGHGWTVYTATRLSYGMYRWSGMNEKKAVLVSGASAFLYMMSIEYLDGRSKEWGWSWADAGANLFGAALFGGQQLALHKQLVTLKFSSHYNYYPSDLKPRADELFGRSLPQRLLKDYNAQSYWLSMPLPQNKVLPEWLSIAVGYSATGMFGGYENKAVDDAGNIVFARPDIARRRQWYLAPDIDLTKIRSRNKTVRTILYTLNSLKFPAPALELSGGKLRAHLLVF